mmetsp:Transcript_106934/g.209602  ORF Transcript_106934/g.209602 Transcript_106934/m.209602 type:complete len:165 (+) Transcript_106934:57-551(+)
MTEENAVPIWWKPLTNEDLPALNERTLGKGLIGTLGIKLSHIGSNTLEATMPVDNRTQQPVGLLHGGASAALAETVGSLASYLVAGEGSVIVGVDISANHLKGIKSGSVTGRAIPIRLGGTLHVWEIKIFETGNEEGGLICHSKHTVMVRDSPSLSAKRKEQLK